VKNRFLFSMCYLLVIWDLVVINFVFFQTAYVYSSIMDITSLSNYKLSFININLIWVLSSTIVRLYKYENLESTYSLFKCIGKCLLIHLAFSIFFIILLNPAGISGAFLFLFYSFCTISLLLPRLFYVLTKPFIIRHYAITKSVAVIGSNQMGYHLASFFEKNKGQYSFRGFLDNEPHNNEPQLVADESESYFSACDQIRHAAETNIREIYVTLDANQWKQAPFLLKEAELNCIRLKLVPDFSQSLTAPFKVNYIGGFPVISNRVEPLENIDNRFQKRLVDILFSLMVIVFLLSWLLPIIALLIKLDSKGPIFFKQKRSGKDDKTFICYKFRTMKVNLQSDTLQATRHDERISRIGRFLRETSLDELPQFFNALIGNMSIVGPRPHMLKHTLEYKMIVDKYMVRNYLKPGITGWAQVNGYRGETDKLILMEKRVEHDIWYLENWSLMLDFKIIFLTAIDIMKVWKK
jgi:putative colanic acid biosynthesis UDP-glucose lipid carrier transferase